jgi:hypothetical protein
VLVPFAESADARLFVVCCGVVPVSVLVPLAEAAEASLFVVWGWELAVPGVPLVSLVGSSPAVPLPSLILPGENTMISLAALFLLMAAGLVVEVFGTAGSGKGFWVLMMMTVSGELAG